MSAEQEVVVGLLAAASSLVAGVLGAGGDILLVPLLLYALPALAGDPLDVHAVAALSLVGSIASTGSGGLRHLLEGSLDRVALWPAAGLLAGGALAGGLLSPLVADRSLLAVFAVVTTAAALLLLVPPGRGLAPAGAPRARRDALAAALLA
ncbi:MAG: TSUP family transporter, partial [Actinomycetota bacterium]|nr:TSUP family transporter [Actinomycetota bacterium]